MQTASSRWPQVLRFLPSVAKLGVAPHPPSWLLLPAVQQQLPVPAPWLPLKEGRGQGENTRFWPPVGRRAGNVKHENVTA